MLLFVAYGFYILLGLSWFLVSLMSKERHFNYSAFFILVTFGVQAYYRHRLTNLILGILALFFSIFMVLDVISTFDLMAKNATYDAFVKSMLAFSVLSIVMACVLIFGYTKMSFKDEL